ncbi:alpha/beta hydrolase family domain-containing protein [Rhizoctonia solani AG-1 IA]|uniref:Alpha/beta hydrolase family domain-containing protein n=1 Tax=Thanatephorus cucumeris (strain AG1-IA) TaxID=983506 RepID=L8WR50_THACA|nr:alpha/beta hydrolase family domain-containing protein [Rhizoctonia solani AG-1 IA]
MNISRNSKGTTSSSLIHVSGFPPKFDRQLVSAQNCSVYWCYTPGILGLELMLSLPPFLQLHSNNTPRQDLLAQGEAQDVKTHYPVVFSHKSQPGSVVGVADAEWWPPLVGDGRTPDALLLFIPGNPGLVEFYTEFLEHLHHTFNIARTHLAILVRGHIGHAPGLPTENGSWSVGLDSQVTSAIELYDSARDFYGPNTKIILAGHSVGSWIVAQWLFHHPIPTIVSALSRLISLPPFSAVPYMLSYISKFNEYPTDQLNVIKSLITSPHVVYSTLTMAHDEMRTIGSLGSASSTVQATCERERSRIYACFAAKDEWVGDEVSSVRAMLDEQRVLVRDDDVPHAFSEDTRRHAPQSHLYITCPHTRRLAPSTAVSNVRLFAAMICAWLHHSCTYEDHPKVVGSGLLACCNA